MIPVTPSGPPAGFAAKVVVPAQAWVNKKGWSWTSPAPTGQAKLLPAHWTKVLGEMHDTYAGVCAYLSVYTHRALDCTSVDHFVPKSKASIAQAYTWANFRLASRPMNTNKGQHENVLDPFTLMPGLFTLNLLSGRVLINAEVAPVDSPLHAQAKATVKRLKLNAGEYRSLRLTYLDEYLNARQPKGRASIKASIKNARDALLIASPFIYHEVVRQGW